MQTLPMFDALNRRLLKFAQSKVRTVTCARCGKSFAPFGDRDITSWSDLAGSVPCPHCGAAYSFTSHKTTPSREELAPTAPEPQPASSRIERRPVSERELLFYIPATGKAGGLMFFAVFWNSILALFLVAFATGKVEGDVDWKAALFLLPFIAVGIGVGYFACRVKFASHLLFLGPQIIRLQPELFGRRKTHDLATAEVESAELKEFYSQNYQPVHGIEIVAGRRKIRFGSALEKEEKKWFCAEIRQFLSAAGNPRFAALAKPPEAEIAAPTNRDEALENGVPVAPPIPPEKTRIERQQPSAHELVFDIPPSGRWGAWPFIAIFVNGIVWFLLVQQFRSGGWLNDGRPAPGFFRAVELFFDVIPLFFLTISALVGLALIYATLRHRFLRHRLTLTPEEVRLEKTLFRRDISAIPTREVETVELFEFFRVNEKPTHAIRIRGPSGSLQFGHRLAAEEVRWLRDEIAAFVRAHGGRAA